MNKPELDYMLHSTLHRIQETKEDSERVLIEVLTIAVARNHNVDLARVVLEANQRAVKQLAIHPPRMR